MKPSIVNEDDDSDSLLGISLFIFPFYILYAMCMYKFLCFCCFIMWFILSGFVEKEKLVKVCGVYVQFQLEIIIVLIKIFIHSSMSISLYGWVYRLYCRFLLLVNENRHYSRLTQLCRI